METGTVGCDYGKCGSLGRQLCLQTCLLLSKLPAQPASRPFFKTDPGCSLTHTVFSSIAASKRFLVVSLPSVHEAVTTHSVNSIAL